MIETIRNQPPGTVVRVLSSNRYAQVQQRVGARCHRVKFLDGTTQLVFASNLVPIRKRRTYA